MSKNNSSIIGQYRGKCCDSEVTNSNGMFLSRELFNTLINSDDYKSALKNGYYIGYLGHPEDPDCQDFKNGCIVMTDMEIEDNGDIYGEFNLIDTPVGRIVKAFIDSGVSFGISIRGVGDLDADGTVDPDSFIFRGFDLVSFPAYADCVPEFQAIAASQDINKKKMYKKVCSVVKKNAKAITSSESLNIIRDQFNENSPEYQELDELCENLVTEEDSIDRDEYIEVLVQKVDGLTNVVIDKVQENKEMYDEYGWLQQELYSNKRSYERASQIAASQIQDLMDQVSTMKSKNKSLQATIKANKKATTTMQKKLDNLEEKNAELIKANKSLTKENHRIVSANEKLNTKLDTINQDNLIYKSEVEASKALVKEKDSLIKSLESELDKTVIASERLEKGASNREDEINELKSIIEATEQILFDYQQAYADSCAYAAGVKLDNVPITAATTVEELKSFIYGSASSYTASRSSAFIAADVDQLDEDIDHVVLDDTVVL